MKKVLIICRTPFQVITGLIIAHNKEKESYVDLMVTSDFKGAGNIVNECKKLSCFRNVFYCDYSRFRYFLGVLFPQIFLRQFNKELISNYGLIYTNSVMGDLENALIYYNKHAGFVLYDEGYSSYLGLSLSIDLSFKHGLCQKISHFLFRREYSHHLIIKQLLYDTDLIVMDMPYKVEQLWNHDSADEKMVMNDVSNIFDVKNHIKEYDKKYIYFEECFACDFNNNGDFEIINTVRDIVGTENLMVKLHPRDNTNRFSKLGIATNKKIGIPTEALISEMSNKNVVFLSFSSGSTINYKFISDCKIKTILLYKLFPESFIKMGKEQKEWFEKFINKYSKDLFAPQTIEELITTIKKIS